MVPFEIIGTGSSGNAVVIGKSILIDCGVPYRRIEPYVKDLKIVLLTHKHGDHFNSATIKKIASERPTIRFACGRHLLLPLADRGIYKNVDIMDAGKQYNYGPFSAEPVTLRHDVPNYGWKVRTKEGSVFYATDTGSLDGIEAKDFDLYLIEGNYEEDEIKKKISEKKVNGEFSYERRVLDTHLSVSQANDFFYRNANETSMYVLMHKHIDKSAEEKEEFIPI